MPAGFKCHDYYFEMIYSGALRIDESIEMLNRLSEDPAFDVAKFSIVDCRDLQTIEYSEHDYKVHASVSMAISRWQRLDGNFRVGVIAPTPEVDVAVRKIMKHAEAFKQAWTRKIFTSYEAAYAWASQRTELG